MLSAEDAQNSWQPPYLPHDCPLSGGTMARPLELLLSFNKAAVSQAEACSSLPGEGGLLCTMLLLALLPGQIAQIVVSNCYQNGNLVPPVSPTD